MLNSEIVSRVTNTINALTKDSRKSRRYILKVCRDIAETLISQKLGEKSLIKEDNIYSTINCFEMERIDVVKCDIIEFRRCKVVMRSKCKLPKLINSRLGNSLKEVTSIDDEREFKAVTPAQYRRNKERGESDYIYYYVKDGYLYIPDQQILMVNLYLITLETENIDNCSSCSDNENACKSLWEHEFNVPSKLVEAVITSAIQQISMSIQIPTDENPNLNSNEK